MKKLAFVLCTIFVLSCLLCVNLAQAYEWGFTKHSKSKEKMQEEVTKKLTEGFLPVGMSIAGGSYNILYIGKNLLKVTAWQLLESDSLDEFAESSNALMEDNFIPMGMSYLKGKYSAIFIQTPRGMESWQLASTERKIPKLKNDIAIAVKNGFVPFCLGSTPDKFLTLFVDSQILKTDIVIVEEYPYDMNVVKKKVDANLERGLLPWCFLKHGRNLYVVFIAKVKKVEPEESEGAEEAEGEEEPEETDVKDEPKE